MTTQTLSRPKHVEIYDYHGQPLSVPVAPQGKSALMCRCGQFATPEEESTAVKDHCYMCSSCDNPVYLGRHSGISPDALPFLDKDTVMTSNWYHATVLEDWHTTVSTATPLPMVHVGTRFAAESRARVMKESAPHKGKTWWIYSLSLKPLTEVAPYPLDDFNGDAPEVYMDAYSHPLYAEDGVTRYLNRYESVGSISLLANPHCLVVEGKVRFENNF